MVVRIGPGPEPGWLVAAVGVGLEVVGWYQISGQPTEAQQLPYLASATIPGAALIVAGTVMVAARRIADSASRATTRGEHLYDSVRYRAERRATDGGLWALPDGNYVHRADCPLIDGKPEAFQVNTQKPAPEATPHRPCPICDPDLEPPPADPPHLPLSDTVTSTPQATDLPKEGSTLAQSDTVTLEAEGKKSRQGPSEQSPSDTVASEPRADDLGKKVSTPDSSDTVRSRAERADVGEEGSRQGLSDSVRSGGEGAGAGGGGSEAGSSDSVRSGGAGSAERG